MILSFGHCSEWLADFQPPQRPPSAVVPAFSSHPYHFAADLFSTVPSTGVCCCCCTMHAESHLIVYIRRSREPLLAWGSSFISGCSGSFHSGHAVRPKTHCTVRSRSSPPSQSIRLNDLSDIKPSHHTPDRHMISCHCAAWFLRSLFTFLFPSYQSIPTKTSQQTKLFLIEAVLGG